MRQFMGNQFPPLLGLRRKLVFSEKYIVLYRKCPGIEISCGYGRMIIRMHAYAVQIHF